MSHIDYGLVGLFRNAVVLRSVRGRNVVLDARVIEIVGESAVAEFSTAVRDKASQRETGLTFKE
jgi:hypothetical protein